MSMSEEKLTAMCEEFPFLKRYISRFTLIEVLVSRANDFLLQKRGHGAESPTIKRRTFLLDKEGNELCEVGIKADWAKKFVFWKPWTWFKWNLRDTISETISDIGEEKAEMVYYIVREDFCHDIGATLTVYKPPENLNLMTWIRKKGQEEQKSVKKEIDAIDATA